MPLASSLLACYLCAILSSVPVFAVTIIGPTSSDAYAVSGAALGALIAALEAIKKRRDFATLASVLVGSAVVGALAPAIAALWWLPSDLVHSLPWQIWAMAGFLSALCGWAIAGAFMALTQRRIPAMLEWAFNKIFPMPPEEKNDD